MEIVKLTELYEHYGNIPKRTYDQQEIYELLGQLIFWGKIILPVVAIMAAVLLILNIRTYRRYKAYLKQCESIQSWQRR